MSLVRVSSISKRFGRTWALRNVSFEVPSGRVAGFLGPNGSGKTTTLKILLGILRRDSGSISVFGMDPWVDEVEVRSRVGVLHERPIYPPNVRVSKLLWYISRLKSYPLEETRRIARLVGLEAYMGYTVGSLSRGYLQRLGIAIALIGDPDLLLLDEPTANLDPLARMEILRLLNVLKRELGVTMIISSHIIPELKRVCDYVIFISGGVTVEWGDLETLAKKYGVTSSYRVEVSEPRGFASEIVKLEYVKGVDIGDGRVVVRIDGAFSDEFKDLLDSLSPKYGIRGFEHSGSELGDMYEVVVSRASV